MKNLRDQSAINKNEPATSQTLCFIGVLAIILRAISQGYGATLNTSQTAGMPVLNLSLIPPTNIG